MAEGTRLVRPTAAELPEYVAALRRGWSPDNVRGAAVAQEHLARIASDPAGFLATADDPTAAGGPIALPDGSTVARLPSLWRWIWDAHSTDGFCGRIGFRWQDGSAALPPTALGHIGYTVVPWRRREGHATRALALILPEAWARGLPHVEVTTKVDNLASRGVIERCGGVLAEHFVEPPAFGGAAAVRYRIPRPS